MADNLTVELPGTNGTTTPSGRQSLHSHHHHHHSARRLRHFLHPSGKKVHVASGPDDVENLRRKLSAIEKDVEFDLVVHGSPEHIEALRETHNHHENAKAALVEKHGDAVDEFERVIRDLDSLSNELHMVSDHAVQLDANFSKYGYSAHLRTKDSPNASSANSMFDVEEHHDWEAERNKGSSMTFWKKPIIRQYFHKGLLWRATEQLEVGSYELFVDLLYVGILAIAGDLAAEHATGKDLLHFIITFTLAWKFWSDIAVFVAWFDADDIFRRLWVLFILTCLLGYTTNIAEFYHETYTPLVSFYLASRLAGALYLLWTAYLIPMVRPAMISHAIIATIPAAFWIGSIYAEWPNRHGLIWAGISLDLIGPILLTTVQRGASWMSGSFNAWAKKTFEFWPGTSIEHRIERTNAFVTLVFGASVLGIIYQSRVAFGINAYFGKAVLGLAQAFAYNWLYFEIDSFNLHVHAIRRHAFSAMAWILIHLPFVMSYVLAASTLAKVVLAHDCANADPHELWEVYEARSHEHLLDGQRWFYCAGLGISLACTALISLTHIHKSPSSRKTRLSKPLRLLLRLAISLVILLLPLAHLTSLSLVATTAGLVWTVLLVELVGATCATEPFWRPRNGGRKCGYSARCGAAARGRVERSVKTGEVVRVEEVARGEGGQGGY
ncbi:hypothetical protein M501DRAFT_978591 [Patellaria atrata CBS 101060]|uniref:Bacterial low temperature requirement A protein-domain-containing protein n=1 Tax=Patellaria atrata CBS 101060 TaxID=1346257 RepID=A0A9P4S674_9PEZI|nr:hypothetical protein M501DRAFT_978591 [Patellaria atrata CBS 101060]